MLSSAVILTNQFYEWEQRGRGWQLAPFSCDLEPPFVSFPGHFVAPKEIIDDAKHPSLLGNLFGFGSNDTRPVPRSHKEPVAYPFSGVSGSITIYSVTLPRHFKQQKARIEQLLVMLSYRKSPVSFEIIATEDKVILQWATQDNDAPFFYSQLSIFFPECTVMETETDRLFELVQGAPCIYTVDFGLSEECMRPLAAFAGTEHDSYLPLFGILEQLDSGEAVIIQVLSCGVHNAWAESMERAVTDDTGTSSFFVDAPEMPQLTKEKVSTPLYAVTVRAVTTSDTMEQAAALLRSVATALAHASTSPYNSLVALQGVEYSVNNRLADIVLRETHRLGMLLNAGELATFVHFPAIASTKLIGSNRTTKQAPLSLTNYQYALGFNIHQGVTQEVDISTEQRLRHIHIMGATGTGKSTLLKTLMMEDVYDGVGFMCLDPHGDLIEEILEHIPEERIEDVVLIDPSDTEFPIGLNILVAHSDIEKELLASDLVAVFKRFSTSWGDAMNSVLANAILAFLYNSKQYHLGDLRRFLIEAPYRTHILATVTDSEITYYWLTEYPLVKSNSIGSILTRLDTFLRPRVIRNMVCQTKSLDFADLMDSNKIVLVKLSQGLIGTENSYLLGAFLVSKLQQTALARQSQSAKERMPFFCYIDEFQHFVTPSMASILSGGRKYGLGLVLCHQDMQQVARNDTDIAGSVLANAGTRIYFRLGDTDAKRLAEGFSSFSAEDLQNLPTGEAIARVNIMSADFNLTVIPFTVEAEYSYAEEIIDYCRSEYSVSIVQPVKPVSAEQDEAPQPEAIRAPIIPLPTIDEVPAVQQKDVREHRYLQTFVKAMAEAHGYKASVEVPTPDGTGLVDVLLEKDNATIAVEISVTTTVEWELHNIQKCLAAGYVRVVVCATNAAKVKLIQEHINTHLSKDEQTKIQIIVSTDIANIFTSVPQTAPTETRVKGYRVKVNYESNPDRQDLLQSILKATKKP